MSLAHSTVVILGGSSGIGLATAKAAKVEGARVVVTGRSADRLKSAQALLGAEARTVALDVADEAGTRALFEELDRVDHVFITAGIVVLDSGLAPASGLLSPRPNMAPPRCGEGGSSPYMSGTTARRPLKGAAVATASRARRRFGANSHRHNSTRVRG
jgi:NAD(P)-dependent dehydrogenase (short-subunit alcohol dehydrogenase family)